jgi:integrase
LPPKPKKLPEAPTQAEVDAWLAQPMNWVVLAAAISVYTGARQGEVREMRVKDVSLANNSVTIRRALSDDVVSTPKSGADRVVPLIPELRAIVEPAMKRRLPEALIVTDENGRTPRRQKVLRRFKALCRAAGTREWSYHSIRHFFVTALLDRGVSAEAVRMLAGHSKLEVTQRYAHASGRDLRVAMARLSRRPPEGP